MTIVGKVCVYTYGNIQCSPYFDSYLSSVCFFVVFRRHLAELIELAKATRFVLSEMIQGTCTVHVSNVQKMFRSPITI